MTRLAAIVSVIVVGLGLLAAFAMTFTAAPSSSDRFAQCRASTVAGGAEIGGPFTLLNSSGETVTDTDVITEPSLIYFGYTYCPDVCPLDVDRNAIATEVLEERGISITPVFISIDPKRDTPQLVGEFAENMHPRMIGLTGSEAQVKAASQAYRTFYQAHDDGTDEYLVDHSTFSYLVLPNEGFVEFFRREVSPEDMADTVQCYVERM